MGIADNRALAIERRRPSNKLSVCRMTVTNPDLLHPLFLSCCVLLFHSQQGFRVTQSLPIGYWGALTLVPAP